MGQAEAHLTHFALVLCWGPHHCGGGFFFKKVHGIPLGVLWVDRAWGRGWIWGWGVLWHPPPPGAKDTRGPKLAIFKGKKMTGLVGTGAQTCTPRGGGVVHIANPPRGLLGAGIPHHKTPPGLVKRSRLRCILRSIERSLCRRWQSASRMVPGGRALVQRAMHGCVALGWGGAGAWAALSPGGQSPSPPAAAADPKATSTPAPQHSEPPGKLILDQAQQRSSSASQQTLTHITYQMHTAHACAHLPLIKTTVHLANHHL